MEVHGINIGIDNDKFVDCNKSIIVEPSKGCYASSANNNAFVSWQEPFGEFKNYPSFYKGGDILTVKLKLTINGAKVSYKINDDEEFCEYNNTLREYGLNYRFAVSMYQSGISVKLLSWVINDRLISVLYICKQLIVQNQCNPIVKYMLFER